MSYVSLIRRQGKEKLQELLNVSSGYSDVLKRVGLKPNGSNPYTLKKVIKNFGLDITQMVKNRNKVCSRNGFKIPTVEILIENSTYVATSSLRNRLVKEGLLEYKCCECGIKEWREKNISLHLDHINGIRSDNRIENLRILCPNCHSQTETYARKQRGVV